MTAIYDNLGIRFMYPENWKMTHEQSSHLPYELSLQTPDGGFWSIHIYDESADPAVLASEALRSMQNEFDDIESEPLELVINKTSAVGFEMDFYCLDMLVTARALGFRFGDLNFLVFYQAECKEFEKLEQVFQAVTLGLVRPDI